MDKKQIKARERIYMSKDELEKIELDILNRRHIERYAMVRQWCAGTVIDVACGSGYGTYLISKNPDVKEITGFDICSESIGFAKKEFDRDNLFFECQNINEISVRADVLISLETIEHLKNPQELVEMAKRCEVREIILSYPTKKTMHYNPFHFHDFERIQIQALFQGWRLTKIIDLHQEVEILKFRL